MKLPKPVAHNTHEFTDSEIKRFNEKEEKFYTLADLAKAEQEFNKYYYEEVKHMKGVYFEGKHYYVSNDLFRTIVDLALDNDYDSIKCLLLIADDVVEVEDYEN